ncbi:MAG: hypothetical protein NT080_02990 [Spirochaetes bacterium]|nr:hypothetical protein [Spirochaetota bacterium]
MIFASGRNFSPGKIRASGRISGCLTRVDDRSPEEFPVDGRGEEARFHGQVHARFAGRRFEPGGDILEQGAKDHL